DILQAFAARQSLAIVEDFGRAVFGPFRVAELGVVVEAYLRIKRVDAAIGCQNQWVDLDKVGVTFDEASIQLSQYIDGTVSGFFVQASFVHQSACVGI